MDNQPPIFLDLETVGYYSGPLLEEAWLNKDLTTKARNSLLSQAFTIGDALNPHHAEIGAIGYLVDNCEDCTGLIESSPTLSASEGKLSAGLPHIWGGDLPRNERDTLMGAHAQGVYSERSETSLDMGHQQCSLIWPEVPPPSLDSRVGERPDTGVQIIYSRLFKNINFWPDLLPPFRLVGHNIGFDMKFLYYHQLMNGDKIDPPLWDTMIAEFLLTGKQLSYAELVKNKIGKILDKDKKLRIFPWHVFKQLDLSVAQEGLDYLENDVRYLKPIYLTQKSQIEASGLQMCMKLELDLIPVILEMEITGLSINNYALEDFGIQTKKQMIALQNKCEELLYQYFRNEKGLNSPKQLKTALKEYGLAVNGTSEKVLNSRKSPICELILEYREFKKLYSTYYKGMKNSLTANNYKKLETNPVLYGWFNQIGTETGRISSNLQQFPKSIEFRSIFNESRHFDKPRIVMTLHDEVIVSYQEKLIRLDMPQIEPRILGQYTYAYAKTNGLLSKFRDYLFETEDCYTSITKAFGAKAARKEMKAIILGVMYGKQAASIAKDLKIPDWKAKEMIELFYSTFTEVKAWADSVCFFTNDKGSKLQKLKSVLPSRRTRQFKPSDYYGAIINSYIQGKAAECNKASLTNLYTKLKKEGQGVCIQEVVTIVQETFQQTHSAQLPDVPIHCSAEIISHWGEAK